jgi:hypothetical protein
MITTTGNNLQDLYSAVLNLDRQLEQAREIAGRLLKDAEYTGDPAAQGSVAVTIDSFAEFTEFLAQTEQMLKDW